jgi:lysophospholipid acyltransferase (LPLAT)-like uncharacterized protein
MRQGAITTERAVTAQDARRRWWPAVAGGVAAAYLRLLARTVRVVEVEGSEKAILDAVPAPYVAAFWHDRFAHPALAFRASGTAAMVSVHRDGELLARCLDRLGIATVRGSTLRGGEAALLAGVRALRRGVSLGVTPDGPVGPRHVAQPGVVVLASRGGAAIVPMSSRPRPAIRFRSWDRFLLPLPGARIEVAYGSPLRPSPGAGVDEVEAFRARLQGELERLTRIVDRNPLE